MIFASKEMIAKARQMDLLTYLQTFEPEELVHICGNRYCTKEHDSLKINGGKWYWFSRGFGGISALDYLIKVKGMPLPKAVETILGARPGPEQVKLPEKSPPPKKEFRVPLLCDNPLLAVRYLAKRGIHPDVIEALLEMRLVAETDQYHAVIFFGYDEKGVPRYASIRGTFGNFKGEVPGSDKRFAFQIPAEGPSEHLHVFEAVIDLLSYASLEIFEGRNWRTQNLLSLGGVAKDAKKKIPAALAEYILRHPEVKHLHLHLDNDEPGRLATEHIREVLAGEFAVSDEPAKVGKDVNDELMARLETVKGREVKRDAR